MNYAQISSAAIELADKNTEKLLYCMVKPEFKSWFKGRLSRELALVSTEEFAFLEAVLLELVGK